MPDPVSDDQVSIRAARASDVPVILELIEGLAEYERLRHEVTATEADLRRTLFGDHPAAEVLLAEVAESPAPVGFALFFPTYSTFLGRSGVHLEDLFVRPEHRGRGIGRRLLRHLAAETVARGGGRLEWSVLDWNEPAIAFYRSIGALPMDEWTVQRLAGDALEGLAAAPPSSADTPHRGGGSAAAGR